MDRDKRWERIERGYDAIVHGEGTRTRRRRRRRSRPRTRAARPTSSSPRRSSTASTAAVRDGDADRPRQLPRRPGAPADARARRRPDVRRLRPDLARRPPGTGGPARRDDDRVRGGPAGRGRVPARGRAARSRRRSPRPAGASSTSPRPRSTPTSRTSSTAGVEAPCPGEDRLLVPSPQGRDLRPPAGDERGRRHRRARRGDRVGRVRLHRRELREPGHGRPHRRLGRDDRARSRRSTRCLGRIVAAHRGRRRAATRPRRARCSRSPPTTATPTTCATRDGQPGHRALAQPGAVRPRRSGGCRHAAADGVLADVAPTLLELRRPAAAGRG